MKTSLYSRIFQGRLTVALLCAVALLAVNVFALDVIAPLGQGQAQPAPGLSPPVADIVKMLDAKVDSEVVKSYIRNSTVAYNPSADEIVALKNHGVPDDVITTLMQRGAELRAQPGAAQPSQGPYTYAQSPPATSVYAPYPDYLADYGLASPYADYGYGYPYYPYYYGYPYGFHDWWWSYGWPCSFYTPFYWAWWGCGFPCWGFRFSHCGPWLHNGFWAWQHDGLHGWRGSPVHTAAALGPQGIHGRGFAGAASGGSFTKPLMTRSGANSGNFTKPMTLTSGSQASGVSRPSATAPGLNGRGFSKPMTASSGFNNAGLSKPLTMSSGALSGSGVVRSRVFGATPGSFQRFGGFRGAPGTAYSYGGFRGSSGMAYSSGGFRGGGVMHGGGGFHGGGGGFGGGHGGGFGGGGGHGR